MLTKLSVLTSYYYSMYNTDSADGIAGINLIGPVTASKLLQQYNNVDGIINAAKNKLIKNNRINDAILQDMHNLPLYIKLATIQDNIETLQDIHFDTLCCDNIDTSIAYMNAMEAIEQCDFDKYNKQIDSSTSVEQQQQQQQIEQILVAV